MLLPVLELLRGGSAGVTERKSLLPWLARHRSPSWPPLDVFAACTTPLLLLLPLLQHLVILISMLKLLRLLRLLRSLQLLRLRRLLRRLPRWRRPRALLLRLRTLVTLAPTLALP